MGAEPRLVATAIASFVLMIGGAWIAAAPGSAQVRTMAAESLAVHPTVAISTLQPANLEPRADRLTVPIPTTPKPTVRATHAKVVTVTLTPTPTTPAPSTTTPTTQAPAPVYTTPAPAPTPTMPTSNPTTAAPPSTGSGMGAALLNKALTMSGVPYVYGGDTPSGFDCSGLVYWAALQLGINSMPRDTYGMLASGVASGLLVPTSNPSYGDLAFFGSGHVEFFVHDGETFGAQTTGTVVGYHSYGGSWAPTMFFKIT